VSFKRTSILASLALAACAARPPEVPSAPIGPVAPAARSTPSRERPCAATARVLAGKKTLRATAFVSPVRKDQESLLSNIQTLFADYERVATDFRHEVVAVKDDATEERAKDAGLQRYPLDEEKGRETAYHGIVFEYGAEREMIKALPADVGDDLEYWVTTKMREVRERDEHVQHRFGIVTRAREVPLTEALVPPEQSGAQMRLIIQQWFPMYRLVDVDLANGGLPADLDGLFVFQPERELDVRELGRVDDFVMLGKPLVVVASAVNTKPADGTMRATLSTRGLDKLTGGYGVEMKTDLVADFGRAFSISTMTASGVETQLFPMIPRALDIDRLGNERMLDIRFAPFFRIPSIDFPFASSLVLHREKQPDATIRVVARTTPKTMRETDAQLDLGLSRKWQAGGEMASSIIAAVVEGHLSSAFDPARRSEKKARVAVIASALLFANPFARALEPPPPANVFKPYNPDEKLVQLATPYAQDAMTNAILVMKNTLDWMADGELAACALGQP
jgi:hypothetical protein